MKPPHKRFAIPLGMGMSIMILAAISPADAASLLSGDVTITNNSPTLSDIIIGPVSGPTASGIYLGGFTFSFTPDTITYTDGYDGAYTSVGPGGFNGFVLTFSGTPTITGISLDPLSQTENPPTSLWSTSDQVFIEFNGGTQIAGQTSIIDVATSAVPEPGAWALILIGFAGLGAALRLRARPSITPA